ncbi:MAG: heparinase II/III family protein [Nitrospirae bacterium]|nr:heparinase II/III family protein [Nitrospirota bacterium]
MKRLLLYTRTLVHLRPTQVLAQILKRVLPSPTQFSPIHGLRLRPGVGLSPCLPHSRLPGRDHSFCFLNQEKTFPDGGIDWTSKDMPKLWRYNLHYFDYLFDAGRSHDAKVHLISDWIAKNPPGTGDAWEPYTLSLRIVNWIKFFLKNDTAIREEWLQSLYTQALWLEKNVEYHILANHYLKNGVALFFSGMYFDGTDADQWLAKGRQILGSELDEQFLPDGGHYERSPMYHAISVVDYLDVLNLMGGSESSMLFEEADRFKGRIGQALDFLHDICLPDGDIPLFNDAALGIAPLPDDILAYANQFCSCKRSLAVNGLTVKEMPHTGYYVLRDGADMMVIDCGAVGPDYQPGHAHADTLSFELTVNGQRVIVDSGVYDYEPGPRRIYARSTKAHNTLCIDHLDQSETWGVFRVARRAYPLWGRLTWDGGKRATFEGAHNGYARLPGRLIHKRVIDYISSGDWTVHDTVEGSGTHTIESYLHIHPAYKVGLTGRSADVQDCMGQVILTIALAPNAEVKIEPGWYFPEFGKELPNSTLVMTYRGEVPVILTYRMTKSLQTMS